MTIKKYSSIVGNSIKDFEHCVRIGYGGSAEVYKAKSLNEGFEGIYFAIKKIRKFRDKGHNYTERIHNEIEIHSQLLHPSIVKFHVSFDDDKYSYIVLDFCEKGSLQDYIKERRKLSEEEACYLIKQVIDGVKCLHSKDIIHRDLSLKNLLLTYEDEVEDKIKIKYKEKVKIADFGLAKFIDDGREETAIVGTFNFMAPEVFDGYYDFKTDCWSVGCVLYALLYGTPPFHCEKKKDIQIRIIKSDLSFPDYASAEAKELLIKLLEKDRHDRITMSDALKFPFFKKYEQLNKPYMGNYRKNADSGISSLSSSASSLNSHRSQKIYDPYDRGSSKKYRYNENISNNASRNEYSMHGNQPDGNVRVGMTTKCPLELSKSKSARDQFKNKMPILPQKPANFDNRGYKTLRKEREISSQIHSFECDDRCLTSTKIQDDRQKCSSHILEYGSPGLSSIHNSNCSGYHSSVSIHKRSYSHHSFKSNESKSKGKQIKNAPHNKGVKEIRTPLITARLKSCKKRITSNKIVSILNDGQVCLELLKTQENKEFVSSVYFISHDGMQIKVFNPQEKNLSSDNPHEEYLTSDKFLQKIKFFTFENLSEFHWKRYKFAKLFVDEVRAVTQKVIIWGKSAKCVMMENTPNPNYEIQFYNGYQITEIGNKIAIKDKNGKVVTENGRNTQKMLDEFEEMKGMCKAAEVFTESSLKSSFPIKMRLGHQTSNKENINPGYSSLLNGTVTTMKSFDQSKVINSSHIVNASQKTMSSLLSNEKSVTDPYRKMTEIQLDLEKCQLDGEKWFSAKYKDGIEMWISLEDDEYFFRDVNSQKRLPMRPDLLERFHRDSPSILRHAFFKQVKKKP